MTLANMIATDENLLICDFAETYQIYDYRSLPVSLAAILAVGLREDSRIKMKMNGAKVPLDTCIFAMISDRLGQLTWSMSEDAKHGRNKPKMLTSVLYGLEPKDALSDVLTFDTPEAFESMKNKIIEGR